MRLRATLQKMKEDAVGQMPAEALETMGAATRQLEASRQAERSLAVGERLPSFALKDHDEIVVSSEDLIAKAPLVLLFYRGVW